MNGSAKIRDRITETHPIPTIHSIFLLDLKAASLGPGAGASGGGCGRS